eukprot:COSAG01_NODE_9109_length_2551_cov_1.754894_2_plen_113_part_00
MTHRCTQLTKTPCSTDKSAPPPPSSYRLELAQCNHHVGVALLRTFIDSYLFDLVRPSLSLATATVSQRSKRASGSGLPMHPPPPPPPFFFFFFFDCALMLAGWLACAVGGRT